MDLLLGLFGGGGNLGGGALLVTGQTALLEPGVLLALLHVAAVAGVIAVLGVERLEAAGGDAVVAAGHGVAFLACTARNVLGIDVRGQRVVTGDAADPPVGLVIEHNVHLGVPVGGFEGQRVTDNFADFFDIADAFGFVAVGGDGGDAQETGHGKGQEFLLHVTTPGAEDSTGRFAKIRRHIIGSASLRANTATRMRQTVVRVGIMPRGIAQGRP